MEGVTTGTLTVTNPSPFLSGAKFQAVFTNTLSGGSVSTVPTTSALLTVSTAPVVTPTAVNATEGTSFSGQVGTLADPGALLSSVAAMVNWGDGTAPGAATVTQPDGLGTAFVLSGTHTYIGPGPYNVTISATDGTNIIVPLIEPIFVADAVITPGTAGTVTASAGTALAGPVAGFTDADPLAPVGDFSATINWGDASATSLGTISQPGGVGTAFVVAGTYTYATAGPSVLRATPS